MAAKGRDLIVRQLAARAGAVLVRRLRSCCRPYSASGGRAVIEEELAPPPPGGCRNANGAVMPPDGSFPLSETLRSSSAYIIPFCTKLMSWPGGILAPLMFDLATADSAPKVKAECRKPEGRASGRHRDERQSRERAVAAKELNKSLAAPPG